MDFLERIMGKLGSEKALEKSTDKRFVNLLRTVYFFRFLFFPLCICLLILRFLLAVVLTFGLAIKGVVDFLFIIFNDSGWINLAWFGITEADYIEELTKGQKANNDASSK